MTSYPALDPLPAEAQPIIDRYRALCQPYYYERIRATVAAMKSASHAVSVAAAHLQACPIDNLQWADVLEMPWMKDANDAKLGHHHLLRKMHDQAQEWDALALAIQVASGADQPNKKSTTIPEEILIEATKELIVTYEENVGEVTGADARYSHNGESTQPSTHFIASCLSAIDPNFDLRRAATTINKIKDWGSVPGTDLKMGDIVSSLES